MANFTEEIKNEILSSTIDTECCCIAFLSAFVRIAGSIVTKDGVYGFEIITENENTALYVKLMFFKVFKIELKLNGVQYDSKSGKDKYKLEYVGDNALTVLAKLGIVKYHGDELSLVFGIEPKIVKSDCCKLAYIKSAFLGGGSCTLPEEQTYSRTGYHFEIVFSNRIAANDFCELLCEFEILAKCVIRKDSAVVYVKSKEVISDLLNLIQAFKSLKKLNKIVEFKDQSNNANRVTNCSVSNIDKTVKASVAQIKAIEIISQTMGLQSLDANLFEVAEARLADPEASMQELADRLGMTKSCLNHRIRKIMAISSQLI
ncbi:MAG: DNA-binding protein WhiA [Candidatus Coproplasma sp.]